MEVINMLRIKGKPHEVSPGVWSNWPLTQGAAERQKTLYFQPLSVPVEEVCEHGSTSPLYYTLTGLKRCCALFDAARACEEGLQRGEPMNPNAAELQGYDFYWRSEPGKFCGHVGKTTLDGKCYICQENKKVCMISPRQEALDAGKKWYTPTTPCRNGHVALRRVNDGACSECLKFVQDSTAATASTPRAVPIHKQFPDMVISHADAKAVGMTVYRTGEPCRAGHAGWRYVSTRNCLTCMGRG
jgi:hypothetical protein